MNSITIGLVFGYLTSFLWCIRWAPTLFYHMKERKKMDFVWSFMLLEALACICGMTYAVLDNLMPILLTNSIGLLTIILVAVNNKFIARED